MRSGNNVILTKLDNFYQTKIYCGWIKKIQNSYDDDEDKYDDNNDNGDEVGTNISLSKKR